jgi:hypothetical protein
LPSLTFVSGESKGLHNEAVTNRIHLHQIGNCDVWQMRQRGRNEPDQPTTWSLIAIVVVKSSPKPKAFYYQFAAEPVAPRRLPRSIEPEANCARCHASGPRAVRPEGELAAAPIVKAWNKLIGTYGVIDDQLVRAKDSQKFPIPSCRGCHDSSGFIRGDLTRQHQGSVEYLTKHAQMPPDAHPLSPAEKECLAAWLQQKPCAPITTPETKTAMQAELTTTLGKVNFHLPLPTATATCVGTVCDGTVKWNVDQITSNNVIRDQVMRNQFSDHKIALTFRSSNLLSSGPHSATLRANGREVTTEVTAHCRAMPKGIHCKNVAAAFNLGDLGLSPPAPPMLSIDRRVTVAGSIDLPWAKSH